MPDYVLLSFETHSPSGVIRGFEKAGRASAEVPVEKIRIDTANISEAEAAEFVRSGNNLAAEVMPLSLVAPTKNFDYSQGVVDGQAWNVAAIGASESGLSGRGCVVAVLDTGIDRHHPAFEGKDFDCKTFVGGDTSDNHGHGTHCAGTIVGGTVEGLRIGVAPGVEKVLVGKVIDDHGKGSTTSLIEGLRWAAQEGAHVVSSSVGFDFHDYRNRLVERGLPEKYAFEKALQEYERNILMFDVLSRHADLAIYGSAPLHIFAAGNASDRNASENHVAGACAPGRCFEMSIGAVGRAADGLRLAPFSNGPPDLVAPGVDVVSAVPDNGLACMDGTSMACAHVAGVAALWVERLLAEDGRVNPAALRSAVMRSCTREGIDGLDEQPGRLVGQGLIRVPN